MSLANVVIVELLVGKNQAYPLVIESQSMFSLSKSCTSRRSVGLYQSLTTQVFLVVPFLVRKAAPPLSIPT
jgi:hypothetical protein